MKVIVTGFDPFGGERINPAFQAVSMLPNLIEGAEIITLELPTVFYDCHKVLLEAMAAHQPELVLCVGQAGGRTNLSFERVAINLNEARIPDNKGQQFLDMPIVPEGPTAYFTNLPIKAMVEAVKAEGIPAVISYTAGTYVCNHIFYQLMHSISKEYSSVRGGFLHVPYAEAQVVDKPHMPSMSLAAMAKGITSAIAAALKTHEDLAINAGQEF